MTAAGQVGEQIARGREEALRRAQAQSEQEARELQSRLAAEQRAARAELANVHSSDWWDRATPEVIGRTYQVARAWTQEDPEAVRAAVERAEQERAQADAERTRAASENAEAQRLVAQANQEDQRTAEARAAAEYEPDPDERARALAEAEQREAVADRAREDGRTMYDSSERREGTARDLESRGISEETVATRMRADVSQAKPATEAVKADRGKSPKARKTRGSRGAQIQRTGLSR